MYAKIISGFGCGKGFGSMITLFKGDDTGGLLGKSVVVEISTEFDLTGCTVIFNYQGIERRWENVHDGDKREVFFSHNETFRMSLGVFKAVILAVDSSGKMRTITNSLPIKVSTNLSECYGDNVAMVTIGTTVNWEHISGKPFEGQEIDIGTDDKVLAALGTIIEKLGGTVKASIALVALCAMSAFGYTPETHTNSFERDGVTYTQRGGLGAADYVVTNVNASGDASILPRYLYTLSLEDTYPEDAEWYYAQEDYHDAGGCSVRRIGNTVERNLDWKFNRAAEFIVRVSGNDNRFASLAVANVGEHLTDGFVRSRTPSRYYKCLAGHSTDGINENGVFAEVNVTSGTWGRTTGRVHGLGAVRWVLDNGTNAQQAAEFIAANVYLPEGFGVNFHYLIADADSTYIVENGTAHRIDTQPVVMTNFNLDRQGGEGYERYDSLTNGATITSQWWTLAYSPDTRPIRFSDLGTNYESIWERWAEKSKEEHRGEITAGQSWWQTLHTAIYDLSAKTLRIAVQETDDWFVFALAKNGTDETEVRRIAADVAAPMTNELNLIKRDITDLRVYAEVYSDWVIEGEGLPHELTIGRYADYHPEYPVEGFAPVLGGDTVGAVKGNNESVNLSWDEDEWSEGISFSATRTKLTVQTSDRLATTNEVNAAIKAVQKSTPRIAIIDGELHIITETEVE